MQRRSFLVGVLAAPAIVRAENLMKIVVPKREVYVRWGSSMGKTEVFGRLCLDMPNCGKTLTPYSSARIAFLAEREYLLRARAVHQVNLQHLADQWLTSRNS